MGSNMHHNMNQQALNQGEHMDGSNSTDQQQEVEVLSGEKRILPVGESEEGKQKYVIIL